MTIHTSQVKVNGLPAGTPVKVNTSDTSIAGYWIKVARVNTATSADTSQSVFLFSFPGYDQNQSYRHRNEFIATVRYTAYSLSPFYYANGTIIEVSSINSNELDGWDPTADIALLVNNQDTSGGAELWVKASEPYSNVYVTPLLHTLDSNINNLGFEVIDGTKTTNNFQAQLPAEHIQNLAGDDRDYAEINGTWSDKVIGTLTLADNVIKDSGGNTILSSNGSGVATFAGNAATATTLATARSIGGVSFNGSANINLPGVNVAGNQDTSGTANDATYIAVTNDTSTSADHYLTFVGGTSGNQAVKIDSGRLKFNPGTDVLTTGHIQPVSDDGYDIGSTTKAFQDCYLEGNLYFTDAGEIDVASGNLTLDVSGDIILDANGDQIYFKDNGTTYLTFNVNGTTDSIAAAGDLTLDATGDITLDADGGQVRFKDNGTTYLTFNVNGTTDTIAASGNLIFDVSGDIVLDAAGDQIKFLDNAAERIVFNLSDTPKMDVAGDFTVDCSGDIILDADGGQINFTDNGTIYLTFNVDGTTDSIEAAGNLTLDATGDITLDAAGDQIRFKDAGTERIVFNLDDTPEMDVTGTFTIDCSNNITLNADGGTIYFKDNSASLGTITSAGYSGNSATATLAAEATVLANARTIDITGDITATAVAFDGSQNIAISAAVNNNSHTHTSANISDATSSNNASTIVERNASGGFSAGDILCTEVKAFGDTKISLAAVSRTYNNNGVNTDAVVCWGEGGSNGNIAGQSGFYGHSFDYNNVDNVTTFSSWSQTSEYPIFTVPYSSSTVTWSGAVNFNGAISVPGKVTGFSKFENNTTSGTAYTAWFQNDGNRYEARGIKIQCGADSNISGYDCTFIIFSDGNDTFMGSVESNNGGMIYGNFTGVHVGQILGAEPVEPGSHEMPLPYGTVLVVVETIHNESATHQPEYILDTSSFAKQKSVFGVYNKVRRSKDEEEKASDIHTVNSIGDGHILVCSEGGDIEIGDYLCSSNTSGHAMLQDDDLLHNYTVAKATQSVKWSEESSDTKLIACTYHCA